MSPTQKLKTEKIITNSPALVPPKEHLQIPQNTTFGELCPHWHQNLNHEPAAAHKCMTKDPKGVLSDAVADDISHQITCSSCVTTNTLRGEQHSNNRSYEIGEDGYSDSCGTIPEVGLGCERHLFKFIDMKNTFDTAIPVLSGNEIPELIEATLWNFHNEYGRTIEISCFG